MRKRRPLVVNRRILAPWTWALVYHSFLVVVILVGLGAFGAYLYGSVAMKLSMPDFSEVRSSVASSTVILAMDGSLLAKSGTEARQWASIDEIPACMKNAVVAIEDVRFYEHGAIDPIGLVRAMVVNLLSGRIRQGGSTITQQTAKFFVGGERNVERKIKEMVLALRMEQHLTKDEILELYLNLIYLGSGAYGIKAAAERILGKGLEELTTADCALLAGLPQAPSRYSPFRNPDLARERRHEVLEAMLRAGFITEAEFAKADASPIVLAARRDYYGDTAPYFTDYVLARLRKVVGAERVRRGGLLVHTTLLPFFQDRARAAVDDMTRWEDKRQGWRGPEAVLKDHEKINNFNKLAAKYYGTPQKGRIYLAFVQRVRKDGADIVVAGQKGRIPLSLMRWAYRYSRTGITDGYITDARRALKRGYVVWVKAMDPKRGVYSLEQFPRVQSAIESMDHRSGYVTAMVGGTDHDLSKFNRAWQACRQPGSTYKPIYYSLALDKGWSFQKKFSDRPYSIIDPVTGKKWRVLNYQYGHGLSRQAEEMIRNYKTTLEKALVWSKNVASIAIFQALGARQVAAWAKRFGFTTPIIADKGLALGASCVHLSELNRAFAIFARLGRFVEPVAIRRVVDLTTGRVIYEHTDPRDPFLSPLERVRAMARFESTHERQAIPARTAYRTDILLRKVVTEGHAQDMRMVRVPVGGKTGTASRTMDTWFTGHTSKQQFTCWLGDDKYERPLGYWDAAHLTTLTMCARFVYDTMRDEPLREIPAISPEGRVLHEPTVADGRARKPSFHPPDKKPPAAM